MSKGLKLLLDSARGVYIPRDFVDFAHNWDGLDADDPAFLAKGPEEDWYWETWEVVLNNATADFEGHTWRLYQDGDLWAVCEDLLTDEEYENFFGEEREGAGVYTYIIDLDERGEFRASVYGPEEQVALEFDGSFFDDGFMKHKDDLEGLQDYLQDVMDYRVVQLIKGQQ